MTISRLIFVILTSSALSAALNETTIPANERAVLKQLYEATRPWTCTTWAVNDQVSNPCSWDGVSCVDGHVTQVELINCGLHNSLPASGWDNLTYLEVLNFDSNQLVGSLPSFDGGLIHLKKLSLRNNFITGPIPDTWSSQTLPTLETLSIAQNQLAGSIPSSLSTLPSLRQINLRMNNLSGSIPPFSSRYLWDLWLSDNKLTGEVPRNLLAANSVVTNDQQVRLNRNMLTGAVPSFVDQPRLTLFSASNNNLTSFTDDKFPDVQELNVASNQLNSILPSFDGTRLRSVNLARNRLHGQIVIGSAVLTDLNLAHNQLTGPMPRFPEYNRDIGPCCYSLHKIDLSYNNLSGPLILPPYSQVDMTEFKIQGNQLTGNVTSSMFSHLDKLQTLDISRNLFRGKVPFPNGFLPVHDVYDSTKVAPRTINMQCNSFITSTDPFFHMDPVTGRFDDSTWVIIELACYDGKSGDCIRGCAEQDDNGNVPVQPTTTTTSSTTTPTSTATPTAGLNTTTSPSTDDPTTSPTVAASSPLPTSTPTPIIVSAACAGYIYASMVTITVVLTVVLL